MQIDKAMNDNLVSELETKQLLSLVRSSLWNAPIDISLFSDHPVNWDSIGRIAMQQTVGILAMQAALSLPDDLLPPKEWIRKAYSIIERNRRTHNLVDKCAAEAVSKLRTAGIKSVLLKGQAYARAYQSPTLRQCGDIDLYVGNDNYFTAFKAANEFGWECEEKFLPEAKHYGCNLYGVRIELHRIAGLLPTKKINQKFQEWSQNQLTTNNKSIKICNEGINVPSPIFTVIFVFLHLYLHFLSGGIGLRHLCDLTMLLHAHYKDINDAELEKRLREFGLLRGWKLFSSIAVSQLGLPKSECPLYTDTNPKLSNKILSFILKEGNFGRASHLKSNRPKGYIAGKIYSFIQNSKRMSSKFSVDPNTILLNYGSYIYKGTHRVILDLLMSRNNRGNQ